VPVYLEREVPVEKLVERVKEVTIPVEVIREKVRHSPAPLRWVCSPRSSARRLGKAVVVAACKAEG
jgi:hypothetical protein